MFTYLILITPHLVSDAIVVCHPYRMPFADKASALVTNRQTGLTVVLTHSIISLGLADLNSLF